MTEDNLFTIPEWQEVPQARFLSWPLAQQYAYCAARDSDSQHSPDLVEYERQFFIERSALYTTLIINQETPCP